MKTANKKIAKIYNTFPAGLKKVYNTSNDCVLSLVRGGLDPSTAQNVVLVLLKECDDDLKSGQYLTVENLLKATFLM